MNIEHTKNAEFLKDLVKLADQLDVRGFTKEADIIDRLIKEAIEEWQYHGYTSPEDYERVKKMRQPELYEKPKEKEVKENVKPETPIRSTDNREFGETLDLLKDLAVWGNGIKRMVRFDDVDYYIETHGRINPDNLVDILDFEKMADFGEVYEKFIESFSITIHNYDPGAQIYITGNKEDLDKLENQELE